jgi:hypothetical protein
MKSQRSKNFKKPSSQKRDNNLSNLQSWKKQSTATSSTLPLKWIITSPSRIVRYRPELNSRGWARLKWQLSR